MTTATPASADQLAPAASTVTAADGFNGLACTAPSTGSASSVHDPGRPTTSLQPYRLVLLDIEGTTTDIAFVHDTLFPYARQHLAPLIRTHLTSSSLPADQASQVQSAISSLHTTGAIADPTDPDAIIAHLYALMDSDTKSTPLKSLQGLLWDTAYKRGDILAHVYSDVLPMLYYLQAMHVPVAIYSSGSIHAQKLLFRYSQFGDLTPLLSGVYFDTTTGPKLEQESYAKIYRQLAAQGLVAHPGDVLFVSDNPTELVAAQCAGLQVVLADRPGNPLVTDQARGEYPVAQVFSQLVWPELHAHWVAAPNVSAEKKRKRADEEQEGAAQDKDGVKKMKAVA